MMNRRALLSNVGAATALLAGADALKPSVAATVARATSASLLLPKDHLAPATMDRLPLEWHKGRTRALQARLAAAGYEGILLTDQWNIIYFTGLFHTNTERMMHAFIPTAGDHPIWFFPALDRDLVRSWWFEDGDMYFDWLNVDGAAPVRAMVKEIVPEYSSGPVNSKQSEIGTPAQGYFRAVAGND